MTEPEREEFDAIVIGSGPGGATVSRELSEHGKKVLILKWGAYKPVTGGAVQMFRDCFVPGKSLFITKNLLAMVRGITTGGSSFYYCALAVDPPVEKLKKHGVDITTEVEDIKSTAIGPGGITDAGMIYNIGVPYPAILGSCKAKDVAEAVIQCTAKYKARVYVNSMPVKPLIILGFIFPRFFDAFCRWTGLSKRNKEKVYRRMRADHLEMEDVTESTMP